jgi:hypothetical protein
MKILLLAIYLNVAMIYIFFPRVVEVRNSYKLFVGKPEGKRPLGKIILKWILGK